MKDKLLTIREAAEYIGVSKGTLYVWRSTNRISIPYVKYNRKIMYKESDLKTFINDRMVDDFNKIIAGLGLTPRKRGTRQC